MSEDDTKLVEAPSSFTPEVETQNFQVSYRFLCPGPGIFRCSLTDLVFVMSQEAKLRYTIIQWDDSILHQAGKTPAGPLYSFSCSTEAVCQLRLPHCEIKDVLSIEDLLSVIHISNDDELSILKPLKITDTHVIVKVTDLSAFGLVWDFFKSLTERKNPVASQVLLYLGPLNPKAQNQKLYVFLLPRNTPIHQVSKDQKDCKYVRSTSYCTLTKDQKYSLTCPKASQGYKIQPKRAEFDLKFGDHYHPTFEIRLPINTEEVAITIQDEKDTVVWEYDVDLTEHSQSDVPSSVEPERTPLAENLLNILDELSKEDFDRFKFFLRTKSQNISFTVHELEDAVQHRVVDLMLQRYSPKEAVQVMQETLRSIDKDALVERITNIEMEEHS